MGSSTDISTAVVVWDIWVGFFRVRYGISAHVLVRLSSVVVVVVIKYVSGDVALALLKACYDSKVE